MMRPIPFPILPPTVGLHPRARTACAAPSWPALFRDIARWVSVAAR